MEAELAWAWATWLNTKTVYPRTVTHLSTSPDQRGVTTLMRPTAWPNRDMIVMSFHNGLI